MVESVATVCNNPEIQPGKTEAVRTLADDYVLGEGNFGEVTVEVNEQGEKAVLEVSGAATFDPVVRKDRFELDESGEPYDPHAEPRYSHDDHEELLKRLTEFLEEPLVIKTVSHYHHESAAAYAWRAEPSGRIVSGGLLDEEGQ